MTIPKASKKLPEDPAHPERICWGCVKLCFEKKRECVKIRPRVLHPKELFGNNWQTIKSAVKYAIKLKAKLKIKNPKPKKLS